MMRRWASRALALALATALLAALPVWAQEDPGEMQVPGQEPSASSGVAPIERIAPPAGTEGLGVSWIQISLERGTFLAAVARSNSAGPVPLVVILHGSHGFAQQYVRLAQDLAASAGVIAVAPCWFGGTAQGARPQSPPIECPDAPAAPGGLSPDAVQIVASLVGVLQTLPGVLPDHLALFGHSRGAAAAVTYASFRGTPQGVMLSGVGFPTGTLVLLQGTRSPLLILHGTRDGPSSGGATETVVSNARALEAAVQANGGIAEAHYAEGAGHNDIWIDSAQYAEWLGYMTDFLAGYVRV
ncbi:MAG: hypothetical protein EXR58_02450 [Chloroflexi bacterium]|nr:hypothetical protein [Chloroflexota bacterium]